LKDGRKSWIGGLKGKSKECQRRNIGREGSRRNGRYDTWKTRREAGEMEGMILGIQEGKEEGSPLGLTAG
jgi:hypothetical protein